MDESDPDLVVLRLPGGSEVAVFSALGVDPGSFIRLRREAPSGEVCGRN